MSVGPFADNDVLIKLSAYRLLVVALGHIASGRAGVLAAARFVVPSTITRHRFIADPARAVAEWKSAVASLDFLEPTDEEIALATAIEEAAVIEGVPLDVGESQLFAIAMSRHVATVVTGDKRAIEAAEHLLGSTSLLGELRGRVACFEQLLAALIENVDIHTVRAHVCGEPAIDKAASICMSCGSLESVPEIDATGLSSYTDAVRATAPNVTSADPFSS